ncbi:MAG: DUF427 domain-containing protein [Microbacterium sp.]
MKAVAERHRHRRGAEDLISIEGNWYFPPSSVRADTEHEPDAVHLPVGAVPSSPSRRRRDAPDRAWSYPHPYPSGIQRVGKDFSDYVAFWKEIRVIE